ncbi:type II secretion system protein GspL [Pseudomonas fluorescens]|uniref:type II secretion system protein GspL n=1 Tax=Pseudomonas fluorescens TaxID=294 RepID=UPI00124227EA|nr:type II secretion system protein GspL [Pseudomonas fluorescens]
MNTWLYLTADGLETTSADWPCYVWSPTCQRQSMPLDQASQALQGRRVDLLLPMELCSWVRSDPWPSRRKPDAQAIAFAVEEQLSEALDVLHLSVGARDREGCYPVMVIDRGRLAAVLELLAGLGIEVRAAFVDADVLQHDRPLGIWWSGRWLLGGGLQARLALTEEGLSEVRAILPKDMHWLDERQNSANSDQWLFSSPTLAINLLQGEYAPRRKRFPWHIGGLSVVMLLLLTWGASELRIQYFESQILRLVTQNEQRFKSLYPDQTRIVDMSAQLNALQSRPVEPQKTKVAGLVSLIDRVIGASQVEVQRVEFRAGEGWKIQLTANNFAELEQLRERGRQQGVPLRLDSASKALDRVQATLAVEGDE